MIAPHHLLGDRVGAPQTHAPAARLAVDADAELHLVLADRKSRLAGGRHRAGGERHAHRARRAR